MLKQSDFITGASGISGIGQIEHFDIKEKVLKLTSTMKVYKIINKLRIMKNMIN